MVTWATPTASVANRGGIRKRTAMEERKSMAEKVAALQKTREHLDILKQCINDNTDPPPEALRALKNIGRGYFYEESDSEDERTLEEAGLVEVQDGNPMKLKLKANKPMAVRLRLRSETTPPDPPHFSLPPPLTSVPKED